MIYNGANHPAHGDPSIPERAYQPAQALFDGRDPRACIRRTTEPFLRVETEEDGGQVANVCFAQALALFHDRWWLYFGMGDSRIGYATAPV